MKDPVFKTEAALCAAFIEWAKPQGVTCYAEWWGWDILVVYPDGLQLGIQAKLRLNAEVIGQAVPSHYGWDCEGPGPEFRAVLVPEPSPLAGLAGMLGLVVFRHYAWDRSFEPDLRAHARGLWLDWNPARRLDLPPVATDSVAGSPCPVTLTHWKLAALDVLAELAVKGAITTKRMREIGVHPGRWTTYRWLEPAETRGLWVRGAKCPPFDEQHPTAYAAALEKAGAPQIVAEGGPV